MIFVLVVALATLHVIAGEDAACADGWHHYEAENKCIRPFGKQRGSWAGAEKFCNKEGGRLLTIHDQSAHSFITKKLQNDNAPHWIGLSQTPVDKRFEWTDGTFLDGFVAWGKGEPNNDHSQDECVVMYGNGFWDDNHCSGSYSFICEKEGPGCDYQNGGCAVDAICNAPTDGGWHVTCSCNHGYAIQDGHCYDINECSYNNGDCDDTCTNNDGSFACSCREGYVAVGKTCTQDTIVG